MPFDERQFSPEEESYLRDVESLVDLQYRRIIEASVGKAGNITSDYASFRARRDVADLLWALHEAEIFGETQPGGGHDA